MQTTESIQDLRSEIAVENILRHIESVRARKDIPRDDLEGLISLLMMTIKALMFLSGDREEVIRALIQISVEMRDRIDSGVGFDERFNPDFETFFNDISAH